MVGCKSGGGGGKSPESVAGNPQTTDAATAVSNTGSASDAGTESVGSLAGTPGGASPPSSSNDSNSAANSGGGVADTAPETTTTALSTALSPQEIEALEENHLAHQTFLSGAGSSVGVSVPPGGTLQSSLPHLSAIIYGTKGDHNFGGVLLDSGVSLSGDSETKTFLIFLGPNESNFLLEGVYRDPVITYYLHSDNYGAKKLSSTNNTVKIFYNPVNSQNPDQAQQIYTDLYDGNNTLAGTLKGSLNLNNTTEVPLNGDFNLMVPEVAGFYTVGLFDASGNLLQGDVLVKNEKQQAADWSPIVYLEKEHVGNDIFLKLMLKRNVCQETIEKGVFVFSSNLSPDHIVVPDTFKNGEGPVTIERLENDFYRMTVNPLNVSTEELGRVKIVGATNYESISLARVELYTRTAILATGSSPSLQIVENVPIPVSRFAWSIMFGVGY